MEWGDLLNFWKKNIKSFFILSIAFFIIALFPTIKVFSEEKKGKNLLVIYSLKESQYEKALKEGLEIAIEKYGENNRISFVKIEKGNELKDGYIKKIMKDKEIDLVICLDGYSAKYISENKEYLIDNKPLIYTDITDKPLNLSNNLAGIYMNYDIDLYLKKIFEFHPDTEKINFIIGKNFKDTIFYEKIIEYKEKNKNITCEIITELDINKVSELIDEEKTISIIYNRLRENAKEGGTVRELSVFGTLQHIANKTTIPIYGGFRDFGTRFNLGSVNFDGFHLGEKLIDISFEVLEGRKTVEEIGIREYKEELPIAINSEIISNYKIKGSLDNVDYYDYGKSLTIFNTRKTNRSYYIIMILIFFLIILMGIIVHTRKLYKERLRIDKVNNNFIANVSHELRTPLNIILSTIQLFELYKKQERIIVKDKGIEEKFRYLRKNALRLLRLVNNIIDFSKMDAGYFTINKKFLNIVEIVEELTMSSVDYAEKQNINLTFDTEEEEIYTTFDKEAIERVVLNLISNALKFTEKNGSVLVKVYKNQSKVYIAVKDSGIGIEQKNLEDIFKRFIQVENNPLRKNEGSGIGLSLCKQIIEEHNGDITVKSELGKGSEFEISIPIVIDYSLKEDLKELKDLEEKILLEYSDFN